MFIVLMQLFIFCEAKNLIFHYNFSLQTPFDSGDPQRKQLVSLWCLKNSYRQAVIFPYGAYGGGGERPVRDTPGEQLNV
jgi:hypothetical protein